MRFSDDDLEDRTDAHSSDAFDELPDLLGVAREADGILETLVKRSLRKGALPPIPEAILVQAGTNFRALRCKSGWTQEEIAARTGVPLGVLSAFESGNASSAWSLTRFDIERLAVACCGSLADLLGRDHPWTKQVLPSGGRGGSLDPLG